LHHWSMAIPVTMFLALATFLYFQSWVHLRRALPPVVTLGHLAAFICGISSIWIAVASPLAMLDHELLSAHMVQHLLLMAVGPPLVLIGGAPACLLLGLRRGLVRDWFLPFCRLSPVRQLRGIALHPMFCWTVASITVIGWHLPRLFALGLHSNLWHGIQQASFLLAGLLFWRPVLQAWTSVGDPAKWSIPLYLFLATLPCDALSAFLTFCGRVVYGSYLSESGIFGISPLQDQEWAGVLMWVCVTFIYMVPALVLMIRILSPRVTGDTQIDSNRSLGGAWPEVS
jgi:putative membrane protein